MVEEAQSLMVSEYDLTPLTSSCFPGENNPFLCVPCGQLLFRASPIKVNKIFKRTCLLLYNPHQQGSKGAHGHV